MQLLFARLFVLRSGWSPPTRTTAFRRHMVRGRERYRVTAASPAPCRCHPRRHRPALHPEGAGMDERSRRRGHNDPAVVADADARHDQSATPATSARGAGVARLAPQTGSRNAAAGTLTRAAIDRPCRRPSSRGRWVSGEGGNPLWHIPRRRPCAAADKMKRTGQKTAGLERLAPSPARGGSSRKDHAVRTRVRAHSRQARLPREVLGSLARRHWPAAVHACERWPGRSISRMGSRFGGAPAHCIDDRRLSRCGLTSGILVRRSNS